MSGEILRMATVAYMAGRRLYAEGKHWRVGPFPRLWWGHGYFLDGWYDERKARRGAEIRGGLYEKDLTPVEKGLS